MAFKRSSTAAQVGEYLGITGRRVQQLAREGWLPKRRHGQYDLKACIQAYVDYLRAVVFLHTGENGGKTPKRKKHPAWARAFMQDIETLKDTDN